MRLAALAGIELQGVLFVLDEPSVGLHHHDTALLLEVIRGLRDRGNTVVVVEHDDQTILQADWIIDVGPGAGTAGGDLLYSGPARAFVDEIQPGAAHRLADSRTRAFLTGADRIALPARRREGSGSLVVDGVTRHNLQGVRAEFRMGALNVVTGVSGAGKSTLVEETRRLLRGDGPAGPGSLRASGRIDKIIEIDQAPIGRTPRSNPATYTGLFDRVRDLFAAEPEAIRLGFGKGRFSFNVHGGRCEACEGAGVRQVGMQFLGTVAVTCESCDGRRFNDATLSVRYRGATIHDVLEMPIADALARFADQPPIARTLGTLDALGLGYLRVGHPATMLSGGEAQRVKLASELARPGTGRTLYILDEPTTGLHPADIARLLAAIDGLVERGNTAIVIEHHLDVIKVADRVIDLGPGSGHQGGRVIAAGTPEDIAATEGSLTGAALRGVLDDDGAPVTRHPILDDADAVPRRQRANAAAPIRFTGIATHNLQHVDVEIPRNRMTVITGVSGSGKSSLAFDTIFAEGQRRFAGSFSTYARRFVQQDGDARFDGATGLTPTVAIRQQAPSRNPRSTVATLTEIHDSYRLLYSRLGTRMCPNCRAALDGGRCDSCGFEGAHTLTAAMFSPNSERGACPQCRGLGHTLACDPATLVTDPSKPLAGGAMGGHKTGRFYGDPHGQHMATLAAAASALDLDFSVPWDALGTRERDVALRGAGDRVFDVEWQYRRGARAGAHRFTSAWPGLVELVRLEYERKHADRRGEALEPLMVPVPCGACGGGRLMPESLAVQVGGVNIHDLLSKTVDESLEFFGSVQDGRAPVDDRARSARRRPHARYHRPPLGPARCGARVSRPRPIGVDAVGRRGAACPSGRGAQVGPDRRHLRARRAHRRSPRARHQPAARSRRRASRCRQHGGRRRTRPRCDRGRRPRDRDRSRRGPPWRARHRDGLARGRGVMRRIENGPPPPGTTGGPLSRDAANACARCQRARRGRPQPPRPRRRCARGRPRGGDRRVGQRQVVTGVRRDRAGPGDGPRRTLRSRRLLRSTATPSSCGRLSAPWWPSARPR